MNLPIVPFDVVTTKPMVMPLSSFTHDNPLYDYLNKVIYPNAVWYTHGLHKFALVQTKDFSALYGLANFCVVETTIERCREQNKSVWHDIAVMVETNALKDYKAIKHLREYVCFGILIFSEKEVVYNLHHTFNI